MNYKAWVAKAPKQSMVLETVDIGPIEPEDVEVAVEHCGLCHSDISVLLRGIIVVPQNEYFPMSNINGALARLESGKNRCRIVLDADF